MPTYRLVESSSVATRVLVGFKMCFLNVLRLHVSQTQRQKRLYKQYMEQLAGAYVERYKGAELKPRWDQRYGYDAVPGDWRYSMSCGCDSEAEGTRSCRSCSCSEWSGSGHCSSNSEPCCSEVIFNGGKHFSGKIAAQHVCHQLPICYPGEFGNKKTSGNTEKEVKNQCIKVIDLTDSEEELSFLLKTLKDKQQVPKTSETNAPTQIEQVTDEKQTLDTIKHKNKIVETSENNKSKESKQQTQENNPKGSSRSTVYNKMTLDPRTNDGKVQSCSRKSNIKRSSDKKFRSQNKSIPIQESSGNEKKHNSSRNRKKISPQSNIKEKKSRRASFRKSTIQSGSTETETLFVRGEKAPNMQSIGPENDLQKPNLPNKTKLLKSRTEWKGANHFRILSKSIKKSPAKKKQNHLPIQVKLFDSVSSKSTNMNSYSTSSTKSNHASSKLKALIRTSARSRTPKSLSLQSKVVIRPSAECMTLCSPSVKPNVPNCLSIGSVSPKSHSVESKVATIRPSGLSANSKVLSRPSTGSMTLSADLKVLGRPSTGCMSACSLSGEPNEPSHHSAESMTPNGIANSKAGPTTITNDLCADSKMVSRPSTRSLTPYSLSAESKVGTITPIVHSGDSTSVTRPSTRSLTLYGLSAESKVGTITPNDHSGDSTSFTRPSTRSLTLYGLSTESKDGTITPNDHSGDSTSVTRPSTRSLTLYGLSAESKIGTVTPNDNSGDSTSGTRPSTRSLTLYGLSAESKVGTITPNGHSGDSKVVTRPSTRSLTLYGLSVEPKVETITPNGHSGDSKVVTRPSNRSLIPYALPAESMARTITPNAHSGDSMVVNRPSTRSLTPSGLSPESKAGTITPNSLPADSKVKIIAQNFTNCHSADSMAINRPSTRSMTPYSVSPDLKARTSSLSAYSIEKVRSSTGSITSNSLSVESKAGTITPNDLLFDPNVLSRHSTGSATSYSFFAESDVLIRSSTGSMKSTHLSAESVILTRLSADLKTLERLSNELENFSKSASESQLSYDSKTMSTESKSLKKLSDDSKTLIPLSSSQDTDSMQWNSSGDETLTQQSSIKDKNTHPPQATPIRDYSEFEVKNDVATKNEVKRFEHKKHKDVLRLSEYSEDSFATEVSTCFGVDSSDNEIMVWKRSRDVEGEINKEKRELINKQTNRQMSERLHERMYEQRYEREFDKKSKDIKDRIQQQITAQLNEKTGDRKKDKHPFKNLSLKLQVFKPKQSKQSGSN